MPEKESENQEMKFKMLFNDDDLPFYITFTFYKRFEYNSL
jgi:hypothetical protein